MHNGWSGDGGWGPGFKWSGDKVLQKLKRFCKVKHKFGCARKQKCDMMLFALG